MGKAEVMGRINFSGNKLFDYAAVDARDWTPQAKKKVKAMNLECAELDVMCGALDKCGIRYECPGVAGDMVAHFIIPSEKVAITLTRRSSDRSASRREMVARDWANEGYDHFAFPLVKIQHLASRGTLVSELAGFVKLFRAQKAVLKRKRK